MTTWYTTVGFGGTPTPRGPWKDLEEAQGAVARWARRVGWKAGELMNAHTVRIYAYSTRAAARDGDISDSPGRHGCISYAALS